MACELHQIIILLLKIDYKPCTTIHVNLTATISGNLYKTYNKNLINIMFISHAQNILHLI
jgi:hypothetical protein